MPESEFEEYTDDKGFDDAFTEFTSDGDPAPAAEDPKPSEEKPAEEKPEAKPEDDKSKEGDVAKPGEDVGKSTEKPVDKAEEKGDNTGNKEETLEDQVSRLTKERDIFKHKHSSDVGRNKAYQKRNDALTQELDSARKIVSDAAAASQTPPEDIEKLKEKSPALYKFITEQGSKATQPLLSRIAELEAKLAPVEEKVTTNETTDTHKAIAEAHSDWKEVIISADFKSWLNTQDESIQAWYYESVGPDDALAALDLFRIEHPTVSKAPEQTSEEKKAAAAEEAKRNKQLEAGASIPNNSGAPQKIPENDEFDASFEQFASKQDKKLVI